MSEKKFQRFGKYLILDHLVDGGMAKICRARYLGEQANKVVAIKMVQPQFSNDEAFMRMFQDELNITFGMLHPNIMQVYDYGKTNGQLYTAMEYIHGANLKQYLDRLKEKKVVFPVEISCYIISQVCLGLHYAHTFTDKLTGKPYNIVHRDISPHNIMLTYDGAVKVIDFGIAKANTNSEATQAGTIKGKLSYLAPEYLDGLELDARYDEFAVGITLWELLCSRKLFQANNDLAVLKQIQACKVTPPSQINPSVPKELDAIVMKALSKDRSQRYENCDQMNRALVRFLYSTYPEFNASDLQTFADDLFKSEISSDREKFVEYGRIDVSPFIEDMKSEESRTGKISRKEANDVTDAQRVRELDFGLEEKPSALNTGIQIAPPPVDFTATKRLSKEKMREAKMTRNTRANSSGVIRRNETSLRDKTIASKDAQQDRDDQKSGNAKNMMLMIAAVSCFALAYFQPALVEDLTGLPVGKVLHGQEPSRKISSVDNNSRNKETNTEPSDLDTLPVEDKPAANGEGKIVLSGLDMTMDLYINGTKTDYVGLPVKVPVGQEVTVQVKKSGYLSFTKMLTLDENNNSTFINIPKLQRARIGLLTTSANYTAGSKLVYDEGGQSVSKELPFKDAEFAEGNYAAKIVNPILGTEKKVEFTIEENKKHFLE